MNDHTTPTATDVRNQLAAMMGELGKKNCGADTIERARAMSQVSAQFTAIVRAEIDAIRLMDETRLLASSVQAPTVQPIPQLSVVPGGRRAGQ